MKGIEGNLQYKNSEVSFTISGGWPSNNNNGSVFNQSNVTEKGEEIYIHRNNNEMF